MALTSIGAFIEGWTLVAPKSHSLSCANLYTDDHFLSFVEETKRRVERRYGSAVLFEHGAATQGSVVGCGVNHAHLHITPYNGSLETLLWQESTEWREFTSAGLNQITGDYLLFVQQLNKTEIKGLYIQPENPISQFFRKILAKAVGAEAVSDYREFPLLESSVRANRILTANQ